MRPRRCRPLASLYPFALSGLLLLLAAGGQAATHRVPKVTGRVETDGRLDEPFWREALRLELTYEVQPGENIPALVRTEALFAYNEDAFLVGILAYDPRPEEIRARVCDRDQIGGDDWVALILDTFHDNRRCFDFFANPYGVQADGTEGTVGGGMTWDTIWDSAGRITAEGYVLEFCIPFSSLRFQRSEADQLWGIDIVRSYPRSVDHRLTLFPRDRNNGCYMCQADELLGFAGARPGRNVEIDPTFSAVVKQERADFPRGDLAVADESYEPGVTARWGFTPNLTAAATINPDFSQVEADAAQLDINRQYALYYDETRPFFIEDSEFFSLGLRTVHTRTLADPDWGVKLTGKEGDHAVGFFSVRDRLTNLLFPGPQGSQSCSLDSPSQGTVLRYRRDVGQASTVGLLLTDREGEGGYYNRLGCLTSRFHVSPKDKIRVQAMGSFTRYPQEVAAAYDQPAGELKGNGYEFVYTRDARSYEWYGLYRQLDTDFRADLGFLPQGGYRNGEVGAGLKWMESPDHWWNKLGVGGAWEIWQRIDGITLDEAWSAWFDYAGLGQTYLSLRGYHDRSLYDGRHYELDFLNIGGGVHPCGWLDLGLEGVVGDGIDLENSRAGRQWSLQPALELRLGRRLNVSLRHAYEHLTVDAGRLYTANVSQLRLLYQFDKRAFLRAILQRADYHRHEELYLAAVEPRDRSLFSQLLFSYTVNPQTVLYLGYSDSYLGDQQLSLTQAERTFFVKIGYAWVL